MLEFTKMERIANARNIFRWPSTSRKCYFQGRAHVQQCGCYTFQKLLKINQPRAQENPISPMIKCTREGKLCREEITSITWWAPFETRLTTSRRFCVGNRAPLTARTLQYFLCAFNSAMNGLPSDLQGIAEILEILCCEDDSSRVYRT